MTLSRNFGQIGIRGGNERADWLWRQVRRGERRDEGVPRAQSVAGRRGFRLLLENGVYPFRIVFVVRQIYSVLLGY